MTTPNHDLVEALSGIGFDANEARVYLTILELGPASVWEIAQKSNLKRPTCYLILDELVLKAYASKTNDGRRTVYSVISPKQLASRLESRQEHFKKTISQLEAMATKSPQKPTIRLFEGPEGLKQAYRLSLEEPKGSELTIYGTATVEQLLPDFIADYLEQRVKKGIRVRALLPDTTENRAVAKRNRQELRLTRFLAPAKFNPHLEINQFGSTIVYLAHSEKQPFATVIDNPTLAAVEKERFNLIWEIAKT